MIQRKERKGGCRNAYKTHTVEGCLRKWGIDAKGSVMSDDGRRIKQIHKNNIRMERLAELYKAHKYAAMSSEINMSGMPTGKRDR